MGRRVLLTLVVSVGCSCCGAGLLTDGTSVSLGTASNGALRAGALLPMVGEGYEVAPSWRARHANYGTDELVEAIVRIGRRLERDYPGSRMVLGDLSYRGGRGTVRHRSHQNGRDLDVFYFAVDDRGRPLGPYDAMVPFAADGRSRSCGDDAALERRFDDARNWAVVRAFLSDPGIEVQWIFANEKLTQRMLAHAVEHDEDPALIERAARVMLQPGRGLPHDDHMHVRVYCDPGDRPFGCVDRGPERWLKKHRKYLGSRALASAQNGGGGALQAALSWLAVRPPLWRW